MLSIRQTQKLSLIIFTIMFTLSLAQPANALQLDYTGSYPYEGTVMGENTTSSPGSSGVLGTSLNGPNAGVRGRSSTSTGYGVYGFNGAGGWGGYFVGNFAVHDTMKMYPHWRSPNIIGGNPNNGFTAGVYGATISGGGAAHNANRVTDTYGAIGGGAKNQAGDNSLTVQSASYSTVGGGIGNTARSAFTTVGGGNNNTASNIYSTVGGGASNLASGLGSSVGGGASNGAGNIYSTVAGGFSNDAASPGSTVGGGADNTASGQYSSVGGGYKNFAGNNYTAVAGGAFNRAYGLFATIPGGHGNVAAAYSFAAGKRARAVHTGAFVWGDSTNTDIQSSNHNQVTFRAKGGYLLFTNAEATLGARLNPNATAWVAMSDRNSKEKVVKVDSRQVLDKLAQMEIATWSTRVWTRRCGIWVRWRRISTRRTAWVMTKRGYPPSTLTVWRWPPSRASTMW